MIHDSERRSDWIGAWMLAQKEPRVGAADIADVLGLPSTADARRYIVLGAVEAGGLSAAAAGRLAGVTRGYASRVCQDEGVPSHRHRSRRRRAR